MNTPRFSGPFKWSALRQQLLSLRDDIHTIRKVAGRNVTIDEHRGKGTVINATRPRGTGTNLDCPSIQVDISLNFDLDRFSSCLTGSISTVRAADTGSVTLPSCREDPIGCLCCAEDYSHSCDCSDCFSTLENVDKWIRRPFAAFENGDWSCRWVWIKDTTADLVWCPGSTGRPSTLTSQLGVLLWRFCSGAPDFEWRWILGAGWYVNSTWSTLVPGIGLAPSCTTFTTCGWSFGGDPIDLGTDLAGTHSIDQTVSDFNNHRHIYGDVTITALEDFAASPCDPFIYGCS